MNSYDIIGGLSLLGSVALAGDTGSGKPLLTMLGSLACAGVFYICVCIGNLRWAEEAAGIPRKSTRRGVKSNRENRNKKEAAA